jgi:GNAT superfamily N-acetyltransferase
MLQVACTTVELHELPSRESINSPHQTMATPVGPIFLQHRCSPSLVESLRADSGLRAFARLPEREHALLLGLARRSDSQLALAYTPAGEIVGQVTLAPADAWWGGLANAYEIAVEVSSGWRKLGIARQLLALVFEQEALEHHIILGMGLSWHWDTEGLGINRFRYRELVAQLFAPYGFVEYLTSEANIRMDPANILLVRLGCDVDQETLNHFFHRLFQSDTLPGL